MGLEFLDAPQGASEDVRPEPVVDPAPEAVSAPEPVAETPPAPAAEPEVKPVVPEGYVPLAVVLDTRDKLRDAEARLATFTQQQAAPKAPDPDEDPVAFQGFQIEQAHNAVLNARLDMSEDLAREKHGEATVDAARDWALQQFQQKPSYRDEVLSQRNPWGYVVKEFERTQALSKLGDTSEVDAFLAWKAAQGQVSATTTPIAAPAADPPPVIPSRSLASAPSAGGGAAHTPSGPGLGYATLFGSEPK